MSTPKIFISYRREDCQMAAGFLYHLLEEHFGSENVFFDVDAIPIGRNFVKYLDEQVSQCDVLLAVIGKRWLETKDGDGDLRLHDENDFVRIEITSALKRDNITVVPVLVEGAKIPKRSALPPKMEELSLLNAVHARPLPDFIKDVTNLIKNLESIKLVRKPKKLLFNLDNKDHVKIEAAIRVDLEEPTRKLTKADLKKVTEIDLSRDEITDVSPLTGLTQLENLYLYRNKITDVSPLEGLKKLKCLNLGLNKLTGIGALAGLKQLTELDLRNNQLTDVDALVGLTKLEYLYLSRNQLFDVSALAGLKRLETLTLSTNNLTEVNALAGLKQLTILKLNDNPALTKAQIDELKKALPKCEIVHNAKK